ncbi:hypothetical protein MRX96_021855 [Rhipicephalus microplus]
MPFSEKRSCAGMQTDRHLLNRAHYLKSLVLWALIFRGSLTTGHHARAARARLCNIFTDLPVWNEFFWPVGFELRELSPGKLSFVQVPNARVPLEIRTEEKEAAKLLQRLLAHHRCVVSVDLDCELFKHHQQMICGELRRCESLEKLALRVPCYFTEKSLKFVSKLPQFDRLRELELSRVRFDRRSVVGLSKLLASTQSLTTLNITEQDVGPEDAVAIVEGLKRNSTITKLLINASLLRESHHEANTMFADFLCKNKTLRTLGVTSLFRGASSYFRPIIEPLYQNTTLTELNLIGHECKFAALRAHH